MNQGLGIVSAQLFEGQREAPQRVLVTGCAGFIGSTLTEALLSDGVSVLGVDCFNPNYQWDQKRANIRRAMEWDTFEFAPVDLAAGDLREIVEDVDTVFHLAGEPGVRSSWGSDFARYLRNNLTATHELLRALAGREDVRLVYASSSSIYGQAETLPTREDAVPAPVSPYGMTKLAAEHLAAAYGANHGVSFASLRFFTVFGPQQRPDMAFNRFCGAAIRREPIIIFGDGKQTRDFTYVDDIVVAVRAAGTAALEAGGAYNLGGGMRASLHDVLDVLRDLSEHDLDIVYQAVQAGDVRDTGADTTKARRDLGFEPKVALADGLAREFAWMEEHLRLAGRAR